MSSPKTRDLGFHVIVAFVVVTAVWLLLTPFVPSVAMATIKRFHLRSGSFARWAVQFPIPAMYNFANQYQVDEVPPDLIDPILQNNESRYVNHFPARLLTFADARHSYLKDGTDRWLTITTQYRGQSLTSKIHAKPIDGGGYEFVRLPVADTGEPTP